MIEAPTYETHQVHSPRGQVVRIIARPDTSDISVVYSTFEHGNDEYEMAKRQIEHWAIDVGAHVGTVGAAVLADNPFAKVIFVEPLLENIIVIKAMLAANNWQDRAIVVHGAIAEGETVGIGYGYEDTGYGHSNRFIGGLKQQIAEERHSTEIVRAYTFAEIVAMADGPIDLVKWDCEGAEWLGLAEPAAKDCGVHVGEYHAGPEQAGLHARLGATHDLRYWDVKPPNGLFEAVRR